MMADIDNEFDEIEALMRDVDTLKIQGDPSSREHGEERRSNAPTDWFYTNDLYIIDHPLTKLNLYIWRQKTKNILN